jgi:CRP/FNR family transcriptional regulator, cyclic AMP receptor protein
VNAKLGEADLERHPFVRGLGTEFLHSMAAHTRPRRYETGTSIAREGDPAREFFLIQTGKVGLELVPHDRPHLTILTLGPGEVFGWSWLVPPHRWRVDARALKPTDVLVVQGNELAALLDAHPSDGYQFLLRLVPVLASRLDATRLQVLDVHSL